MFFSWDNLKNKGNTIKYSKKSTDYLLLKLSIPEEFIIKTNYYSWCDFIYFLEYGIDYAKKWIPEELGCTYEKLYDLIFDLNDGYGIVQNLIKFIDKKWILEYNYVEEKII